MALLSRLEVYRGLSRLSVPFPHVSRWLKKKKNPVLKFIKQKSKGSVGEMYGKLEPWLCFQLKVQEGVWVAGSWGEDLDYWGPGSRSGDTGLGYRWVIK